MYHHVLEPRFADLFPPPILLRFVGPLSSVQGMQRPDLQYSGPVALCTVRSVGWWLMKGD